VFENWPLRQFTSEFVEQRNCLDINTRKNMSDKISKQLNTDYNFDFHKDVKELKSTGIMIDESVLSAKEAEDMYDYFAGIRCYDFYGTHESFTAKDVPSHVKLGRHTIKDNLLCPKMIDLITNEDIIKKASSFLNAPATLSLVLPMWSFPYEEKSPINMQLFHRDADDYKFVKFFILLSAVEFGEGEQVYLKGSNVASHLPPELYKIERYPDQVIKNCASEFEKIKVVGKAGTNWFADTYGIHRGTVPSTKPRLLLQLQFSYSPVPIFNYKPYRYSKWNELSDLQKYATRLYLKENR
jgi:hypothetical protein